MANHKATAGAGIEKERDAFIAGFICAGGEGGEARSQALQFLCCCYSTAALSLNPVDIEALIRVASE